MPAVRARCGRVSMRVVRADGPEALHQWCEQRLRVESAPCAHHEGEHGLLSDAGVRKCIGVSRLALWPPCAVRSQYAGQPEVQDRHPVRRGHHLDGRPLPHRHARGRGEVDARRNRLVRALAASRAVLDCDDVKRIGQEP
eukprot:2932675-Prymnesium_polylepis.2